MLKKVVILVNLFFIALSINAQNLEIVSPNEKIKVSVHISKVINFEASVSGTSIIKSSNIGLNTLEQGFLGRNEVVKKHNIVSINNIITPVVKEKRKEIIDNYNELVIDFKKEYSLIFRVYNNGFAYRFKTNFKGSLTVIKEQSIYHFNKDYFTLIPRYIEEHEKGFITHAENTYINRKLSSFTSDEVSILPLLVKVENNVKVLFTEADLRDYPGLYVRGNSRSSIIGVNPHAVKKQVFKIDEKRWDRNPVIFERENYIAKTKGKRVFPWRVFAVSESDKDLLNNQLVYQLSLKNQIKDPSWIKPGKASWDWWNYNNIYGVDFRAGINTETYKYFIDFASENGLEYIILDEGWYELGDILNVVPDIDMEEIVSYAKQKNVGIILWVIWKTFDNQLEESLDQFEKWGIKGIKIDFMQRDDQQMVNWYYKIAEKVAEKKMFIDFHGAYKPSGLRRAYPNVITREGVPGLEHSKWGEDASPKMAVTIPFIRMVSGPIDYTPGGMLNANKDTFAPIFNRPMTQGTRCHQLAMYVVFESPLQMLADSPSNYKKEQESLDFIAKIPTVWDETVILSATVGEHILTARKSEETWFVGALSGDDSKDLIVDFSFLEEGEYTMEIFQDGINADRYAGDYKKVITKITNKDTLNIHLSAGGGWTCRIFR